MADDIYLRKFERLNQAFDEANKNDQVVVDMKNDLKKLYR
jgi:hypothetical protein